MTTTTATEHPGLEAKAQEVFGVSYAEMGRRNQAVLRAMVERDAAADLLKALCHAFYRTHEYSENCSGCAAGRDAIAKAEGRTL